MVRGAEPLCFGDRMAGIYTCMAVCSAKVNVHEQYIYLLLMEKNWACPRYHLANHMGDFENTRASHNNLFQTSKAFHLAKFSIILIFERSTTFLLCSKASKNYVAQIQCYVSTDNHSFPRQYVPIYIQVGANKKRHGTIPVVQSWFLHNRSKRSSQFRFYRTSKESVKE
jgi:hypothetical protein